MFVEAYITKQTKVIQFFVVDLHVKHWHQAENGLRLKSNKPNLERKMTDNNCKYEELAKSIEENDFQKAKRLALELLPKMNGEDEAEEAVDGHFSGLFDFCGAVTADEFDFSKSIFELAWSLPVTPPVQSIRDCSIMYCDRYENEISKEEYLSIVERLVDNTPPKKRYVILTEFIVFAINSQQYDVAVKRLDELGTLNKLDAMLFKSHLLRYGLGMERNVFEALKLEVESTEEFNANLKIYNVCSGYGYRLSLLDDSDPLFEYDYQKERLEINLPILAWYIENIELDKPLSDVIKSLRKTGILSLKLSEI